MNKVFIVVQRIAYEGDTVLRVFANYKDAVTYADELTMSIDAGMASAIDYDVFRA